MPAVHARRSVQPTEPSRPFLLAADIDGTLLGDEEGESALSTLLREYPGSCTLVVVSGRALSSVQQLVAQGRIPPPDYIGSSVGTELLACGDASNSLGRKYAAQASQQWSLERIYALGQGDGIRRQQFPGGQPPYQAGFDWDGRPHALATFRRRLKLRPELECRILASSGQYIDVVPQRLGKGELVQFLQRELSIDQDRVVVAGDSGNDREMFETGFNGVVPVNALEELRRVARQPWHFQSSLPAARGVIEGLCHFGLLEPL